jgi:parallel beta-helix repeat protein
MHCARPTLIGVAMAIVLLPVVTLQSFAAGSHGAFVQLVSPGDSIQVAIDQAALGGWIFVLPGVYRETADATNGLNISKGIHLVGLSTARQRVVLENTGNQGNGIVVVPSDRTRCMSCHTSLAPPFPLQEGVTASPMARPPTIHDFSISGVTIRGFDNNGLFLESVDGFRIVDVESVDNRNYGIFPTLSRNGVIDRSRASGSGDSGVWVETSTNVRVTNTVVENNLMGIEVSNSDDVLIAHNESRYNSIGMGILLLVGLFDDRASAKRITIERNLIHDNNRVNDNPPDSFLGTLPFGVGILHFGVDDSLIARNRIEGNGLAGIALVDVCLVFQGTDRDCSVDPRVTPEFLADQAATGNRIVGNILVDNGTNPGAQPFAFAASDLALLSLADDNCYARNVFTSSFSILGEELPACP